MVFAEGYTLATSPYFNDEEETMYEDISRDMHSSKTHFTVVIGDFNVKLGKRDCGELTSGTISARMREAL